MRVARELLEAVLVAHRLGRLAEADLIRRDHAIAGVGQRCRWSAFHVAAQKFLPCSSTAVRPFGRVGRHVHVRHAARLAVASEIANCRPDTDSRSPEARDRTQDRRPRCRSGREAGSSADTCDRQAQPIRRKRQQRGQRAALEGHGRVSTRTGRARCRGRFYRRAIFMRRAFIARSRARLDFAAFSRARLVHRIFRA